MTRTVKTALCLVVVGIAFNAAACSSGDDDASPASTTNAPVPAATTTTRPRPPGPVADLSTELTGGKGMYIGEAEAPDLKALGYAEHEFVAEGTAASYKAVGGQPSNGRWKFAPDGSAPYRTRVLVRAPAKPADFNGTVIFEWLNVSAGVDANPEWVNIQEEEVRAGDAWVGVSAQRIGVEGGPTLVKGEAIPGSENQGKGLKAIDPTRYGSLEHPGDGYSFDIYTQVARAIRAGAGMNGSRPVRMIAAGQSQSAVAMVSYFNGVQPLTRAFDGFFVHSRFSASLPLVEPGGHADLAGAISASIRPIFRTDQDVPIMDIQTESDVGAGVINSYSVRQPDTARFRLWEVAGTAHADVHQVGDNAKYLDCGVPINNGPMHIVAKAALRALRTWLTTGEAPVIAPRLDIAPGETPEVRRDADAIALGGIRTPPVDVPVATLSGAPGPVGSTLCLLIGSTKPFAAARLAELYSSRAEYLEQFEAAADAAIEAGFVLPEDRAALMGFADPSRVAG